MKTTQLKSSLLVLLALAGAFFFGAAQSVRAAALLYEPFDPSYTNSGDVVITFTNGLATHGAPLFNNNGWTAGQSGGGNPSATAGGMLTYPNLVTTNTASLGVYCPSSASSSRCVGKQFTTPNISSGSLYASFLVDVLGNPTANRFVATLSDSATDSQAGVGNSVLVSFTTARKLLIAKSGSSGANMVSSNATLNVGSTNFVVVRYNFTAGEMALWLNPNATNFGAGSEPVTADIVTTVGTAPSSLGYFFIQQRNNLGASAEILMDELRVSTNWADVTPLLCSPATVGNPASVTTNANMPATFTVNPGGFNPSVQWEISTNGGSTFNAIAGATATSFTTNNVSLAASGNEFRAIATVTCNGGSVATSSVPAILTVNPCVSVGTPGGPSDTSVSAGASATFTITPGTGSLPGYQWQISTDAGATFNNVSGGSGANSLSYTTPTLFTNNDQQKYQCVVTNACDGSSATSAVATVTVVCTPVGIVTQPVNYTTAVGDVGTFSIVASGSVPTYQWQTNNGGGFVNAGGATSSTFNTATNGVGDNGLLVQCIVSTVSCDGGTTNSVVVTQFVSSATAKEYQSQANGDWSNPSTWQWSFNGGSTWQTAEDSPTAANSTNILVLNNVTVTNNTTIDQTVVGVGGNLIVGTGNSTTNTLTVNFTSGADLDVFGTVTYAQNGTVGNIAFSGGAIQVYESGGKLDWSNSLAEITAPTATWNDGSTMEYLVGTSGNNVAGTPSITNLNQNFYNFAFNGVSQTKSLDLAGGLTTVRHNLTITNAIVSFNATVAGGVTNTLSVGNDIRFGTGAKVLGVGPKAGTAGAVYDEGLVVYVTNDFIMGGTASMTDTASNNGVSADFVFAGAGLHHLSVTNLSNSAKYQWVVPAGNSLQLLSTVTTADDASGRTLFDVDGTLDLNGLSLTARGIAGAGVITNGGSTNVTLTVGNVVANGNSTFNGVIADNGVDTISLSKSTNNSVILTAANTYSGSTSVGGGTLSLSGSATIANSPTINVSSGANLDSTLRTDGTLHLGASQTLTGSGSETGILDVSGTVSPAGGSIGTLTAAGNVTFESGSTLLLQLDRTNSPNIDAIACSGTISVLSGAILTVVNINGAATEPTWGDVFSVFSSGPSIGAFTTDNLPSITGTAWGVNLSSSSTLHDGSLDIVCPTITVSGSLPVGTVGTSNGVTYSASGGLPPYTYSSTGTLPPNTVLDPGTGNLGGTPTNSGTFIYTIIATDSNGHGCTGTLLCTNVVNCPAITVGPATLTDPVVGFAYAATNTASGGTGPYVFTVGAGFPLGLTLASNGEISGTPTNGGSFTFTVTATDIYGCSSSTSYTNTVSCPTITLDGVLPGGTAGTPYTNALTASGGVTNYTFTVGSGLPGGLTLSSGGLLSGTPTNTGSFNFTVTAHDSVACTGSSNYTVVVNCGTIVVSPGSLSNAVKNVGYTNVISASGGLAPYHYTQVGLPAGFSLVSSNGVLKGKTNGVVLIGFTVTAIDAAGCSNSQPYTLLVVAAGTDTTGPTTAFKHPTPNEFMTSASLVVTGTVSDVNLITNVEVRVDNTNSYVVATLAGASANSKTWSLNIGSPVPGNHSVSARGEDVFGNVGKAVTNAFYYGVYSPLTIVTNGNGSIVATPVTGLGTPTNGANLVIGKSYQIKLVVGGDSLLSNLVSSATGTTNLANYPKTFTYSFVMQSNLTLTVNYVANRFLAAAGTYYGLFSAEGGVTLSNAGFFTAKVTSKSNKLASASGTLDINGYSESFSIKAFGLDGTGTSGLIDRSIHHGNSNALTVQLILPLDNSGTVTGSVTSASELWVSGMSGDQVLVTNGDYNAQYTMVIPPIAVNADDSTNVPGGYGYGIVNITNGVATVKASLLGDGQAFTSMKANVSQGGQWPLFSWGNKTATSPAQRQSIIMGWLTVGPATNQSLSGTLDWVRNGGAPGRYSAGFTNEVTIQASPYGAPAGLVIPLTLSGGTNFGIVTLQGGGLTNVLSRSVTLAGANVFTFQTNTLLQYSLKLTAATGKLTGATKISQWGGNKQTFTGVVLTNANVGLGLIAPTVVATNVTGDFELNPQ